MVRLTRLRIDRLRNVKPGTDLRFGPTFNVLLGRNATGKSTLLDLIAAVTNDDLSAYAKEDAGFDLTWWLEDGEIEFELWAMRKPSRLGQHKESEFDDRWEIVVRAAGAETARVEVTGTRGVWKRAGAPDLPFDVKFGLDTAGAGSRTAQAVSNVQNGAAAKDAPLGAMRRVLWHPGQLGRFDEALASLNLVMRSFFELRNNGSVIFDLQLPEALLAVLAKRPVPDPLVVRFEELGELARVPALLGFTSAELRPRLVHGSQDGATAGVAYQGFDCLFRRADGSRILHHLLSFGQKRLFAFLWYLDVRQELPVVADELLNGLHHEWIQVCMERLRDRQSFLATQDAWLLDHVPIESADAVQTTFVRCSIETAPNGRDQMAWRNFDEEEAERFFVAYQTGIQHVSEVLRTEGLW